MRMAPWRTMKLPHPSCATREAAAVKAEIHADPGRIDAQIRDDRRRDHCGQRSAERDEGLLQEHRPEGEQEMVHEVWGFPDCGATTEYSKLTPSSRRTDTGCHNSDGGAAARHDTFENEEPGMTEPVRIHMRVPGTAPMPELMAFVESIEAAGFDGAGIVDSQMIARDTFVILGHAAAAHEANAVISGCHEPVHAARLGARERDPDRRGNGAGARQVRHRHRLQLGDHDRTQARDARRDAHLHRYGEGAARGRARRLERYAQRA